MYWIILLLVTTPSVVSSPAKGLLELNRNAGRARLYGRLENGLSTCNPLAGCGASIIPLTPDLRLRPAADTDKLMMDESLQVRR